MKSNLFSAILACIIFSLYGCSNQGNEMLSPKIDNQTGKFGFVNQRGHLIIPYQYEKALNFNFAEGLAFVKKEGKWGCINKAGDIVIPMRYDYVLYDEYMPFGFSNGLAMVCLESKWGLIDKDEKEVVTFEYDRMRLFSEGLAVVCLDNKYGYIDKTGKVIIPLKYDRADSFKDGFARVELHSDKNSYFFIDKTATKEYTSLEMKIIWEKWLEQYFKPITHYRSKLKKSSCNLTNFSIKRPYLYIVAKSYQCRDLFLRSYSEYDLIVNDVSSSCFSVYNEIAEEQFTQDVDGIKTIIIEYHYIADKEDYSITKWTTFGPKHSEKKVTSYGSFLIYFDVDSKKCIGFDTMHGRELPKMTSTDIEDNLYLSNVLVRDQIETRLEKESQ